MPIKPSPHKLKCPKCGYTTVVKPKSDTDISGLLATICPKCSTSMLRVKMSVLDDVLSIFTK